MLRRLAVAAGLLAATMVAVPHTATATARAGADPVRAALDKAFAEATGGADGPGVQAVAMRNGKVIWSARTGRAVDDPPAPVTGRTLFSLASFGKLILGAYALHLADKGTLALDRPISAHIGTKLPGANVVTPRMLLTHTSGYPDLYTHPSTAPLLPQGAEYDPNRPFTFAMLAPGVSEPVKPGSRYEYSNTGFIILAHVLTEIAGGEKALERDVRRFLARAGERGEHLTGERAPRHRPRFAHGYIDDGGGKLIDYFTAYGATGVPTDVYGLPFGDGMFAGTAFGAARFLDALFTGRRLLRPATLDAMIKPTALSVAAGQPYGMAALSFDHGGRTWKGHAGAYGGFTSLGATDRAGGVTIAVVANRLATTGNAQQAWAKLAKAYADAR
ncbi:serine hydrolase domain-containing protein [Nonomuraea sp. NPDC050394]|uniref:serine hydrolase domain-containing protein n=1 Tax=Nonomuraea sp. NPDC050394 TaxID=3364363 RepID=UPI003797A4FE